jgi:hypothetical protein
MRHQYLVPLAEMFHITPAAVDDLSIYEFDMFCDAVDERIKQANRKR